MLSHALDGDVAHSFSEIPERVNSKHAQGEALHAECEQVRMEHEALAEKARALEARVFELDEDHRTLRGDVATLRSVRGELELEVQAEREFPRSVVWPR